MFSFSIVRKKEKKSEQRTVNGLEGCMKERTIAFAEKTDRKKKSFYLIMNME